MSKCISSQRVREIHALHVSVWGDGCDACVDAYTEQHVPYPCPTIRALDGAS